MNNAVRDDNGGGPLFFLSYARSRLRSDNRLGPDYWVSKLFNDLCSELEVITAATNLGFMDRQIPVGSAWTDQIARAIATCRVFIPLYSLLYFDRDYCGREWAAFASRTHDGNRHPRALIPALWTGMEEEEIPENLRSLQFTAPGFPDAYKAKGFYGIMKQQKHREHYKEAVCRLAQLIKSTAKETALPVGPVLDLSELKNPFERRRSAQQSIRRPIRVTIAAPRPDRLPAGRDSYYYGRAMIEWVPYRSTDGATPIAQVAERALADLGHDPVVDSVDAPSPATAAGYTVLIVDPWVTRDPIIGDKLRALGEGPVYLLIPVNEADRQTVEAAPELIERLRALLPPQHALRGAATDLRNPTAFHAALVKAAARADSHHLKTAEAHPPETPPSMPTRPTLKDPEP